jgi:hypothetical protein
MKKRIRPLGQITQDMEELLLEMTEEHELHGTHYKSAAI